MKLVRGKSWPAVGDWRASAKTRTARGEPFCLLPCTIVTGKLQNGWKRLEYQLRSIRLEIFVRYIPARIRLRRGC